MITQGKYLKNANASNLSKFHKTPFLYFDTGALFLNLDWEKLFTIPKFLKVSYFFKVSIKVRLFKGWNMKGAVVGLPHLMRGIFRKIVLFCEIS